MKVQRIYNKNGSYSTSCPNCGAPINKDKCDYCGAIFIDFACMDVNKPFYLKIKKDDNIYITKVSLSSIEMPGILSPIEMNGKYYNSFNNREMSINLNIVDNIITE